MGDLQTSIAECPTTPTYVTTDDVTVAYCPGCGYDLRGATTNRCSECGLEVDPDAAVQSAAPWASRRRIGRFRAFWKTVWLFSLGRKRVRNELSRRQYDLDARWFRFWNGMCIWLAILPLLAAIVWKDGPSALASVRQEGPRFRYWERVMPGAEQDWAVPWSAGISLLPALPLYAIGLSIYLASCGKHAYRLRKHSAEHRQRAKAVSAYASASLAYWLPGSALISLAVGYQLLFDLLDGRGSSLPELWEWTRLIAIIGGGIALVATLNALHVAASWIARAYQGSGLRYAAAMFELLVWWGLGAVLYIGVLPWCVGLWRIMLNAPSA